MTIDADLLARVRAALELATPGPWNWDWRVEGFDAKSLDDPTGYPVICAEEYASSAWIEFSTGDMENRANAALIALAPDMARALVALADRLEGATDPDFIFGAIDNVHDMDASLEDYARAASRAIRAALDLGPDPA